MSECSKEAWAHVIPCALQYHLDSTHADSPFGGLLQIECRKAFQGWVERAHAESGDALACPMLWCRKIFDDHQTTIRHTLRCPWLPNAWYWCPECSKPERFMSTGEIEIADSREITMKDSIEIVKTVPTPPMRRKSSKMRKAVTFFKHHSWKSVSKEQTSFSGDLKGTKFGTDNKGEIDSLERQFWEKDGDPLMSEVHGGLSPSEDDSELVTANTELPTAEAFTELPTLPITSGLMGTNAELPTTETFSELPALTINPAVSGRSSQLLDDQNYACPLPNYSFAIQDPRYATLECSDSKNHLINTGLAHYTPQHDLEKSELILRDLEVYEMPTALPQQLGASISEYGTQIEVPELADPTNYISGPPLDTQVSIQDIYKIVGRLSSEWLARLDFTPHLGSRCSKLAAQDLFDRGFKAMQQCFDGSLADSFEDIFSLVHVAYACAYWLHKDEVLYDWDGLFVQILQWQYLLSSQDDVQCFLMAMDQLMCKQNYHLTHSLSGGSYPDQQCYEKTFDMLRTGPIMRDCSMFLDGLQCKGLYERNMESLSDHLNWHARYLNNAIQYTIDEVTTPLRGNAVTEGFLHIIDDVEFQLHAGLLRNIREVEIMLIINGKTYAGSFEAFEDYKRAIMNLCDRALGQPDSSWRNHYYAVVIDKVLEEGLKISKHTILERQPLTQDLTVLAVVGPCKPDENCTPFVTSAESEITNDTPPSTSPSTLASTSGSISPSTSGSSTFGLSPSTDSPASYATSPTTASTGSPTSPAEQNSSADVSRCPGCLKTFKGTSGPTNLQRHLRSSNAHGIVQRSSCHIAGCGKTFTRTDNMHHHIRTVHNESPIIPMQQRGGMKRRRESDGTVEIRPRGIRPKGMVQEGTNAVILQGQDYDIREKFVF